MDYSQLISIENLFQAWEEFRKGKRNKRDVQLFERHLEDNLFDIHQKLKNRTFKHGKYSEFYVNDPKRRHIHKAGVTDRIVHHLLYKYLYEVFDKTFIFDSYSCRLGKGTHKAVDRLFRFSRIISKNNAQECWALKLDIRQFFASVDHEILMNLIAKRMNNPDVLNLIEEVIDSFSCHPEQSEGSQNRFFAIAQNDNIDKKGIPLGNLTSQIFANIYLNELDQFIKHNFKIKHYLRYADDFILLSQRKELLTALIQQINTFLNDRLKIRLHPDKIILRKLTWGIGFCGYIVLPHYRLVRTKTKRRIIKKILRGGITSQSLQSYLGYFLHANTYGLRQDIKNLFYL